MTQRMPEGGASTEQEYLAFISYRHADNTEEDRQWATWLHQQLEIYDVPDDLIGTINLRGDTIPERIYPVFRDEVSLSADADLSSAITKALDQSRFLIVLCSPRAVQSRYVNEEILHFKRTGKEDQIMAALILGEPNASIDPSKTQDPEHANTLECFPSALQYELTVEGQLNKTKPTEPIAANFRLPDGGKGITNPNVYKQQLLKKGRNKADADRLAQLYEEQINNARLKIIAGILGVPLERLTQRDKIYQLNKAHVATRRFRKIAVSLGALALVALIAGGIAVVQWRNAKSQQERAENLLNQIYGNLDFMNFELRGVLDNYVPLDKRMTIMNRIDAIVEVLQQHGNAESIDVQREIAAALMQKADQVLKNDKLNPREALPLYQKAQNAIIKISQQEPNNTEFQRDLSVSHERIGDLQLRLGNTDEAFKAYQDSLAIRQTLTLLDPNESEFQRDLSVSHEKIGDLQLRLGNADTSLKSYQDSLAITQTLAKLDPNNTVFQRDLSVSHNKIGELQLHLGNAVAALKSYKEGLVIVQTLTKLDPNNTVFQRDLSVSHNKIGDLQLRLGNTDESIKAYQESLAIRQTLAKLDPNNTVFKHDLSVSNDRIGDLQLRLGNTDAALKVYQDSLSIRQTLTKLDPNNTVLQRDFSVSHNKIGDLQLRLGNADAALKSYQDSLAIAQALTKIDPNNTVFQRDEFISNSKLYECFKVKKEIAFAKIHLEKSLKRLKSMEKNGSLPKEDEQYIKTMEMELLKLAKQIKK